MKLKSIKHDLPKINKSIIVSERKIKDSFNNQKKKKISSVDIDKHRLFRKRIIRLKEQKMKDIINTNKTKFFNNENSLSSLSPIKSTTKDEKNSTCINFDIPHLLRKNNSDIFSNSKDFSVTNNFNTTFIKKQKDKEKRYFLNAYRDLKLNYSKYLYIKNNEVFLRFIINRFVTNKKISHQLNKNNINNNQNIRKIYCVMQNSIITNYNDIPGNFFNIPTYSIIKTMELEKRQKLYQNLLKRLTAKFECKRKITSIFSPNKELITDLLDIKKEFKYIYVSQTIICKSISVVISPNFINLYNNEFQDFLLGIRKSTYILKKNFIMRKRKNKYKIKNITKGIKSKYEKLKPHYSFSAGENEIDNINYLYYSDDEEKKNQIEKDKNCYINKEGCLKNDFFLYLNEREIGDKLKSLKSNLYFKTPFKLKESYDNFRISFEKLLSKFRQEVKQKFGLNPKNFNTEKPSKKNKNYDFSDMDNKFEKLFLQKNFEKIQLNKKFNKKSITNVDKKVNKQYSYFLSYNIPRIVPNPKIRKKFFEIFGEFKDLISIALSLKQNDFILKNGLDFDTFWNCIPEIQDEREFFAKKLFTHMNKSNSSLLNIQDFLKGMNFIKNSDLSEKLELYMNSMDIPNANRINFKDAVKISMQSLLKHLDENMNYKNADSVLNDLSLFLASYIFDLCGVDKNKSINIEDLKKIINKYNEENYDGDRNDLKYLQMFCGI